MKINKATLFIFIAASIGMSSCETQSSLTGRTQEVSGGIVQTPVIGELSIKNSKVTGVSAAAKDKGLDYVKTMAVADALKQANADVLIEPTYDIETTSSQITVHVTGFAATYTNFRIATPTDAVLLDMSMDALGLSAPVEETTPNPSTATKSEKKIDIK